MSLTPVLLKIRHTLFSGINNSEEITVSIFRVKVETYSNVITMHIYTNVMSHVCHEQ
jgi:hypothetical protein